MEFRVSGQGSRVDAHRALGAQVGSRPPHIPSHQVEGRSLKRPEVRKAHGPRPPLRHGLVDACPVPRTVAGAWWRVEQLLSQNMERFRGGLVFKVHRLLYHSTLGLRVIKQKKKVEGRGLRVEGWGVRVEGVGLRV